MPSNIEIKSRLTDFAAFHALFEQLFASKVSDHKILQHCDTYFKCETGRLKLREIILNDESAAELIFYSRSNTAGPKLSDFVKYDCTGTSSQLKELLTQANGLRGVVNKTRHLYIVGQTRVHIDEVEGLGSFMELEVMMKDGQPIEEGTAIAHEFMEKLKLAPGSLIEGSYIDLLDPSK
ncbi:uncharacterized protein LOC100908749 [Galendromus occidentalis]|uniref:Uncharacterized protein LOC100908749 n=1 Tax=Galendromus occidentalis TaxID=34638 RepID=A0AAJ6QY62_9ACAR|nr:uncharacterized protein LOC100908749 [Galendromus occidentalis]